MVHDDCRVPYPQYRGNAPIHGVYHRVPEGIASRSGRLLPAQIGCQSSHMSVRKMECVDRDGGTCWRGKSNLSICLANLMITSSGLSAIHT